MTESIRGKSILDLLPDDVMKEILAHCKNKIKFVLGYVAKYFQAIIPIASEKDRMTYLDRFAGKGYYDLFLWCRSVGCKWDSRTTLSIGYGGNVDLLEYAYRNGCIFAENASAQAALKGHFPALQWFESKQIRFNTFTSMFAAQNGSIEILKYLRERCCPFNSSVYAYALMGGHFNVIKWLYKEGCSWDSGVCTKAADVGNLKVLRWLRKKQCPWDENVCNTAAGKGHLKILKYAISNGCDWNTESIGAFAVSSKNLDMLKFVVNKGAKINRIGLSHCLDNVEMFSWILEDGFLLTPKTYNFILNNGTIEVVEWLLDNVIDVTHKVIFCDEFLKKVERRTLERTQIRILERMRNRMIPELSVDDLSSIESSDETSDEDFSGISGVLNLINSLR